ncbi:MAG: hypothetical protein JXN64_15700 [Spirochaetes bacterium]|nr:hypothetical protein [Spirochaetota bacterium]
MKIPSAEHPSANIDRLNAIITTDPTGKEIFAVKDLSYKGESNPLITDILLSFNTPSANLRKDDSGKYIIRNALYKFIDRYGVLGGGGAAFFRRDHIVEIEPSRNLWLGSAGDLGSFSLEFRVYPSNFNNEGILFSRVGYFSGKKNGIEIKIKDRKVIVQLFRLFKDAKGIRYDAKLIRGRELDNKKWHHFMLSFDRVSGKVAKYINGMEEDVIYATATDKPFEDVYEPSFESVDMPAAFIGKNFYGYIDEFRIMYRHIDDLKKETDIAYNNYKKLGIIDRLPLNKNGIITSPVYDFASTGTSVSLVKWNELLNDNTYIWMEFRISDNLFEKDDKTLKWYRIVNNQKNIYLMKEAGEYLRGKYYQWRAYLVPSPDGKTSPYFYDVELTYRLDPPPSAPQFLNVAGTGDMSVRLRWNKNVEHDILGYRIYYGVVPDKYDGIIGYINGKRITNDFNENRKYIEVEITNNIIEENKDKDTTGVLEYPLMENTVLYFFTVSAYDSYRPDTPYNHESLLSVEVKARPFAGSEIK